MSGYCKGIYVGCCAGGSQSRCDPCERIKRHDSTIAQEIARKRGVAMTQRCAYKHCGKLYEPKRSKSKFCSNSCANTQRSLTKNGCFDEDHAFTHNRD